MNSKDYRNIREAYIGVYDDDIREKLEFESWVNSLLEEGYDLSDYTWDELYENYTQLDESGLSQDTIQSAVIKRQQRNDAELEKDTPEGDAAFKKGWQKVKRSKSQLDINKKFAREGPTVYTHRGIRAEGNNYDLYDIILSHLLDEGYADTEEAAEAIMVNMSEEWRESVISEMPFQVTGPDPRSSDPNSSHVSIGKPYQSKKRAETKKDKLDDEIGGYRHRVKYVS
jgi:hypothetical protein